MLKISDYSEEEIKWITKGFKKGFRIGFEGDRESSRMAKNLTTGTQNPNTLRSKVMKEVKLGRSVGPFTHPPLSPFWQSPLGLVPKKDTEDMRMTFHLSYPHGGKSVNSQIPKEETTVNYPEFDDAVKMCIQKGQGCYMANQT